MSQTLNASTLLAVPMAPLVGSLLAGILGTSLGGNWIGRRLSHTLTIAGVLVAFIISAMTLKSVALDGARFNETLYTWMVVGGLKMEVGFLVDGLSAMMMCVVTFVSLMVHIYTIGYMEEDEGYNRFFAYISLFTFAMLMLVMSNNMLQLFFGWEAVGLVSYLLIGFWFNKPTAIFANMKAFLVNRVGDFGNHIAEAGANPISQLAFTLSNGFTFVEAYLARGMNIDDFAPNLSFFFSNGMDPEYTVLGRVARRLWAIAMREKYGANERAQKLKYHIQTSGRSLHAQEVDFNDIRTTLQALIAIYDNCNSLHTNAYDEAITTPTDESVRRALAIQLIINREWGLAKNENPNQGSFIIEELTDLVEEAVLQEFERIAERGGVLGAMETGYQRGKIQEESMLYEHQKHDGTLPIIGVNTFRNPKGGTVQAQLELARSTDEEKQSQLQRLANFHHQHQAQAAATLAALQRAVIEDNNVFAMLMDAVRVCSLGQITDALFAVGGQYRRNM